MQAHEEEEEGGVVTVDLFVTEFLHNVGLLHLEILDRQMNEDYLKDGQESLQKARKRLADDSLENTENAIMVSYCRNKQLITDIFKVFNSCQDQYYSIKYRVATVHQNFQSVYAEDSNRQSTLALDPLDEKIFLSVLGRRLVRVYFLLCQDKNSDEDYREIAQVELPIFEVNWLIRK